MTATFHVGDAIEVMGKLPENSVDLVLTSPPFLALRSYLPADHPDKPLEGGSQSTPGEYIDWLIDVVEACDRVLTPHGSLCVELGDTYAGSGGAGGDYAENGLRDGQQTYKGSGWHRLGQRAAQDDQPPNYRKEGTSTDTGSPKAGTGWPLAKSLSLIPELFRLTLVYGTNPLTGRQTERWRLRNVIRWVRPNPPVGALGDKFRPATSELMVFCKSAKRYFDLDAVRESSKTGDRVMWQSEAADGSTDPGNTKRRRGEFQANNLSGAPPLDWWNIPPGGYEGAHYAVWPPELLIKPVKAMSPERVCRVCGEPSRRVVKSENASDERQALADYLRTQRELAGVTVRELAAHFPSVSGGMTGCVWNWENAANVPTAEQWPILKELLALDDRFDLLVTGERTWTESEIEYRDVSDAPSGWTQDGNGRVYQRLATRKDRIAPDRFSDCGHDDWRPGLVLDPFGGSGTTALVATGHGRDCILIDLDSRNFELALQRVGPLMLERAG